MIDVTLSGPERGPEGAGASSRRNSNLWPPDFSRSHVAKNLGFVASSHLATGEPFSVPQMFTHACTFAKCGSAPGLLNANFTSAPPLHSDASTIFRSA